MRPTLAIGALAVLVGACGDSHDPAQTPTAPPTTQLATIEHDFGVIPHGETREHDFVLDLAVLGRPHVPLRTFLDCSCGRAEMFVRDRHGKERPVDGSPAVQNAPGDGETLVVRVTLTTGTREPVDLPHTATHASVLLQPVDSRGGAGRVRWPLLLRFGVDVPVEVRPFAALDFGRVPASRRPELLTTLRGDAAHPGVRFGPVTCTDPAIAVALEPADDHVVLRARCTPGQVGSYRATIRVGTDLAPPGRGAAAAPARDAAAEPGAGAFHVELLATWKVVPDLEAQPTSKIAFRTDLSREQNEAESQSQFLLVTDHDLARDSEFALHELVTDDGHDARSSFAVRFAKVPGDERTRRLYVRYLGGLTTGFRGRIVLSKGGAAGPFLPIELVAFPAVNR
jgi:hypothetical protein